MSSKTTDRRVSRTRETLQQCFCALLRRKRYEAITVDDICSAANVGRSTFYAHYKSKDDLKRSGLAESLHSAVLERQKLAHVNAGEAQAPRLNFSLSVFEHARDHLDHYRTLAGGRGGVVALAKVRQMVTRLVCDELALERAGDSASEIEREAAVEYVVGGYMAMLTWWLDRGAKLAPGRIDAMFRELTTRGVAGRSCGGVRT
ncbi:MAG TPA: TetR/AcrR family transcriptional regulator [Steroidobacteraceae bacterium]|nr:TetR/AcrR family transcriptional regulator [Steroidobacteraceae bacterium]